jgi:outer membrane protein TolC
MSVPNRIRPARLAAALAALMTSSLAGATLDLPAAERLALQRDLSAPSLQASAQALNERAVAEGQLPDPRLKLGAMNLPVDSFDRDQEPMTQMQVGVQQAFPPGQTRQLRQRRTLSLAEAGSARAQARRLAVKREVRLQFLELYYLVHAGAIVDRSQALFQQLVEVTESQYAAGRKNQQDVLRANVELALLEDRHTRIRTQEDEVRAALARLIGPEPARQALDGAFPRLTELSRQEALEAALPGHPLMRVEEGQVKANQLAVGLARERYKPGWMLDLTYGDRTGENPDGTDRDDFFSAMVLLDIPLFTDKRQDRRLAASQQELAAAQLNRDDRLLELKGMLEADYAQWLRLGQRIRLYEEQVLPQAEQHALASLQAYQSGVTDFSGLMRARLNELDSRLTALRLRVDRAKTQARLLYLMGEQP